MQQAAPLSARPPLGLLQRQARSLPQPERTATLEPSLSFKNIFWNHAISRQGPRAAKPVAATLPAAGKAAPRASEVHHGVTLRGAQLTHAILVGAKRVENRHFKMQPGWYALHTGASTSAPESQHALIAAVPSMPSEASLPHSCIVGAIEITHSLDISQCANEPWAFGPVVNVIGSVVRLERPVPHKGALSLWRIQADAADDVHAQLASASVGRNDMTHLPPP